MAQGSALQRISRRVLLALSGAGLASAFTGNAAAESKRAPSNRGVLQDLYDSEINASVSSFWDGGFDVKLGDMMNGFDAETQVRTWQEVEGWLTRRAIELYPSSVFALIYSRWSVSRAGDCKATDALSSDGPN